MSLVKICEYDAPAVRSSDRINISKQHTTKRRTEELLRDKRVLDVNEKYIDVLYYIEIFILSHVGTLLLRLTVR